MLLTLVSFRYSHSLYVQVDWNKFQFLFSTVSASLECASFKRHKILSHKKLRGRSKSYKAYGGGRGLNRLLNLVYKLPVYKMSTSDFHPYVSKGSPKQRFPICPYVTVTATEKRAFLLHQHIGARHTCVYNQLHSEFNNINAIKVLQ